MLRSILAAVLGYLLMAVVVMAGMAVAWGVLGGTGAFEGEGPAPSGAWVGFALVFGFLAALVGGVVARKVGRGPRAVSLLVTMLVAIGVMTALSANRVTSNREPINKPVAEMTFMEAGQHAVQPTWFNWVIPFVGAFGAYLGGVMLVRPKKNEGDA